ncbi:hypothetical protein GIB67_016498 [Kingdonia uniflora]|uniref:RING-type E3 ubiquitin transferase n=1 Tax=Kingdonia uniflora TaxID=39325 RepID=A0A7J7M8A5_9MAGN|nr:hypothetical protein GIB67_016498 [Kingdonia uniflora]
MENHSHLILYFFIYICIFLLLLPHAYSDQYEYDSPSPKKLSLATLVIVAILSVFSLVAFFVICMHCSQSQHVSAAGIAPLAILQPEGVSEGRLGPDLSLIEMFPTFLYSVVSVLNMGNGVEECAVCLNHFKDDDIVRLLPKCDHGFHLVCIDAWLSSNDTCPVCRDILLPIPIPRIGDALSTQMAADPGNRFVDENPSFEINNSEVWIRVIEDQNSNLILIQNQV